MQKGRLFAEEAEMLMQMMESKGTVASKTKELHAKVVADLTEAKTAHRTEVGLLRTELIDALEAADAVQP